MLSIGLPCGATKVSGLMRRSLLYHKGKVWHPQVVSGKVCKGSILGWSSLSLLFL